MPSFPQSVVVCSGVVVKMLYIEHTWCLLELCCWLDDLFFSNFSFLRLWAALPSRHLTLVGFSRYGYGYDNAEESRERRRRRRKRKEKEEEEGER